MTAYIDLDEKVIMISVSSETVIRLSFIPPEMTGPGVLDFFFLERGSRVKYN